MVKIVVGGQMDKQSVFSLIEKYGQGKVDVTIKSDIEAAMAIQTNQADYYFGACATGAGGALAMAIGLVGAEQCLSASIPGKILSDDQLRQAVRDGKKAFGFVNSDAERVIPVLMDEILKN